MLDIPKGLNRRRGRGKGQIPIPWTKEEEERLRALVANLVTIPGIAREMNRSESAIKGRLTKLGLIPLARRNRSNFHRGSSDFTTANLRFTFAFNERLANFCFDRDVSRSSLVEDVITAFMNQIENGAGE